MARGRSLVKSKAYNTAGVATNCDPGQVGLKRIAREYQIGM